MLCVTSNGGTRVHREASQLREHSCRRAASLPVSSARSAKTRHHVALQFSAVEGSLSLCQEILSCSEHLPIPSSCLVLKMQRLRNRLMPPFRLTNSCMTTKYMYNVVVTLTTWNSMVCVCYQANERVEFSEQNTVLTLTTVTEEDSGVYQCVASNRGGSITTNATLRVGGTTACSVWHNTRVCNKDIHVQLYMYTKKFNMMFVYSWSGWLSTLFTVVWCL